MKFKTKPCEIEAWRWDCGEPMPWWILERVRDDTIRFRNTEGSKGMTFDRDNVIYFNEEHWILLDTEGNPYPCHETVFEKKYERV